MNSKTFIIFIIFIILFLVLFIVYKRIQIPKNKNDYFTDTSNLTLDDITYLTNNTSNLTLDDITYLTNNTFIPELATAQQNLTTIHNTLGTDYNNPIFLEYLQEYADDNLISHIIYNLILNDELQYNLDTQKKLLTYKLFNRAV